MGQERVDENKIGLAAGTVIGMNAMIGAGIVAMPAMLSGKVGPAGIVSYLLAIGLAMLIGVSLAYLAEIHPGSGWSYFYPSKWGGHKLGMFSASCYLGGVLIAMGFLVQQAGVWSQSFVSGVDARTLGIIILVVLTALVLAGAEASSFGQYVIAALVLIPLLITASICWLNIDLGLTKDFMPYGFIPVLAAAPKALFTLMGFESIASLYSIVRNPKRNVPLACVLSITFVGSLYVIFAGGVLLSIPSSYFAMGVSDSLANVIGVAFPSYRYLSTFVLVGGLFAIIGTLHSMIWSLSSLFTDVVKKSKSSFMKDMLSKGYWNNTTSVLITSGVILLTSIYIHADSILYSTVCFVATAYVLSISLLLFEKQAWKSGRNYLTLCAVFGGIVMFYYAVIGVLSNL